MCTSEMINCKQAIGIPLRIQVKSDFCITEAQLNFFSPTFLQLSYNTVLDFFGKMWGQGMSLSLTN